MPDEAPSPKVLGTAPLERPVAMREPTADGAAAASTYFLRLHYEIFATGDTAEWEQLSGPGCGFCARRLEAVTTMHMAGNRAESAPVSIDDVKSVEILPLEAYSTSFQMHESASRELTASGEVVSSSEGGSYDVLVALTWSDGWRIEAVDISRAGDGS